VFETKRFLYAIPATINSKDIFTASLSAVNVGLNVLSIAMILFVFRLGFIQRLRFFDLPSLYIPSEIYIKNHFSCLTKILIKLWR
jgi:hypothetical protein